MKLLVLSVLCFFHVAAHSTTYYLSPSGNDNNSGTISSPWLSLNRAWNTLAAGDILYLRGGNYLYTSMQYLQSKNGTAGNLIKIWAYPGETPVLTRNYNLNSNNIDLIYFEGNFIHFKGLEIANSPQRSGEYPWSSFRAGFANNCIWENINYHHNAAAMQIKGNSSNNLILNCDFHHNADPYGSDGSGFEAYDGADGFAFNNVSGTNNTIRGCRSWWNADDGFDLWDNNGYVLIENCWAFWNGYIPGTFNEAGNGSGFKLGLTGAHTNTLLRTVQNCIAHKNRSFGIVENATDCRSNIFNNTVSNTGLFGFWFGVWNSCVATLKNNISYNDNDNQIGAQDIQVTNSWQGGLSATSADFVSTDDSQLITARQADGSLPIITFLNLVAGSDLINSGSNVGLPFNGTLPDIGAFESGGTAPPNQAPTANAGSNQNITLPVNIFTLTGTGNDPDGSIAAYQWTKITGPLSVTITFPLQATTTVITLLPGVYQFELRVTDNQGAFGRDTVTVTVNAAVANQLPTANAGLNQNITLPTNSLTLTGSGNDPDGSIAAYQWTKLAGSPSAGTIVSPAQASTVINSLVQGVYQFELRVTDNQGAFGRDTVTVTVNAAVANQLPTANAGLNQNITLPTNSLTLTGSGNDPDGSIAAYQWTKLAGSPSAGTIVSPAQASTVINSLVQGVYQFELRVTDNQGAFGRDTVTVTVNAAVANQLPTANAGLNQNITLPTNSLTLTGSGNDPDGSIAAYQWTKLAGSPSAGTIVSPAQASTVINSLVQGVYQFELRVTDNQGAFGRDTVTVTVNAAVANQLPTANAGLNQNITLPTNSLTLTGSGNDPDGSIAAYQWTKLAGSPSAGTIVSPAQASTVINSLVQGVYQFELRVTDNQGAFGRDTVTVTVNAAVANQLPTANAGLNQNITLPTNSLTLTGSGNDPDGSIAAYQWTKLAGSPSAGTIVSPAQASTVINSLVQGVYQFELRVTDNQGAFGRDTVTVTVNAAVANQLPTANAGLNQNITLPTNSLTLTGSGNDPDGSIAAYQWTKLAGSPSAGTIVSPAQASTVINSLVQGVYQFELRVTDNQGAFGRDTVTVTVNAAVASNMKPSSKAGKNKRISLPTNNVMLEGSGTDLDGTITNYNWRVLASPAQSQIHISSPQSATTEVVDLIEGLYEFELEVVDNNGEKGIDTVEVEVVTPGASIFPNPVTDKMNLRIDAATISKPASIIIYDMSGKLFYKEYFIRNQNSLLKQINVSHFPRGTYIVEVLGEAGKRTTVKMIKQ